MERNLVVLYGSQSGCSREVAKRVAREARRWKFNVTLSSMDSFDINKLPSTRLAVFICSTTGQGETPDNMKKFWRFLLRRDLPKNVLSRLSFTTFGLGDSSYPIYNAVARRLHERLLSLGAKELCVRGLGDDQHQLGYDGGLVPWFDLLQEALMQFAPNSIGEPVSKDLLAYPQLVVDIVPHDECDEMGPSVSDNSVSGLHPYEEFSDLPLSHLHAYGEGTTKYQPYPAEVTKNLRLTPHTHSQAVHHIEIDISDLPANEQNYEVGDVLNVHPPNPRVLVETALRLYSLHANDLVFISSVRGEETDFPRSLRAWELFTWYLDLSATPQRYIFEFLAQLATDPAEKERLEDLITPDYADTLHYYCGRERRSFIEVFCDFSSALMPLHWACELIPRITPRSFSIASSSKFLQSEYSQVIDVNPVTPMPINTNTNTNTNTESMSDSEGESGSSMKGRAGVHLCVAVVEYTTPYRRKKTGLCSGYLRSVSQEYCVSHSDSQSTTRPQYTINPFANDKLKVVEEISGISKNSENEQIMSRHSSRMFVSVRKGSFRLDVSDKPVILIGPGTGISAFAAYAQHLLHHKLSSNQKFGFSENSENSENSEKTLLNPNLIVGPSVTRNQCLYVDDESKQMKLHQSGVNSVTDNDKNAVSIMFGCRNRAADHYYRELFSLAVKTGAIDQYQAVFSRNSGTRGKLSPEDRVNHTNEWVSKLQNNYDEEKYKMDQCVVLDDVISALYPYENGNSGISKNSEIDEKNNFSLGSVSLGDRYVQHRMTRGDVAHQIYSDLILRGGTLIIAGNSKNMPRDVRNSLVALISALHEGGVSEDVAKEIVEGLVKEGRYMLECWG